MISSQLIRFLAVGFLCTALNYLSFFILLHFLQFNFLLSSGLGYVIGLLFGYFLNRVWTFRSNVNSLFQKAKYLFTYSVSLIVGLITLQFLVEKYGLEIEIANICVIFITTILNFLGTKFWVFHK